MKPENAYVLEIHSTRPIQSGWDMMKAEEDIYEENERHIPVVFYFFCETEEEAKRLRDEILRKYPDTYEVIRRVREDEIL